MTSGESTAAVTPCKRRLSGFEERVNPQASVTDTVLMIRPCRFGFNEETASSNKFQSKVEGECQSLALKEFDRYVEVLRNEGVTVFVVDDTPEPPTPDSIFPNNWISTDSDGTVTLYPMFTANRRDERSKKVLPLLRQNFVVKQIIDLSPLEQFDEILEGTGSLVLDKKHRIVYAALGPRTTREALHRFARSLDYGKVVAFEAEDSNGHPIYHTNVLMTVGERFAIVALEVVKDKTQRSEIEKTLKETNKTLIEITESQMREYAGNCLQLKKGGENDLIVVISARAKSALEEEQLRTLESFGGKVVAVEIPTIETVGGGSARCMLAELFLQAAS